jgi:hypothetical protein
MAAALLVGVTTASAAAGQGEGLVPTQANLWPRWQGRLVLDARPTPLQPDVFSVDSSGLKISGAGLLGDYYFARSLRGVGSGGGFRATSGVFLGAHAAGTPLSTAPAVGLAGRAFNVDRRSLGSLSLPTSAESNADNSAIPYLGVGYTGMAGRGGWGFSADFGLMALGPGSAVKLGRVFTGNQSLDGALRDMRLSPLLQLGISYSF